MSENILRKGENGVNTPGWSHSGRNWARVFTVMVSLAGWALFWVAGCSGKTSQIGHQPATELITVNYAVADTLHAALCGSDTCELPMLMSSFVSLDDLDQTSPLGRIIPQQIGSRLAQHGLNMLDVRLRSQSLLVRKSQGEFALSRELEKISRDVSAYSVLTGTYTVVYGRVYVTAMVLRSTDGVLLASLDYSLPVDRKSLVPGDSAAPPAANPTREELPDPFDGTIQPSVYTRLSFYHGPWVGEARRVGADRFR